MKNHKSLPVEIIKIVIREWEGGLSLKISLHINYPDIVFASSEKKGCSLLKLFILHVIIRK